MHGAHTHRSSLKAKHKVHSYLKSETGESVSESERDRGDTTVNQLENSHIKVPMTKRETIPFHCTKWMNKHKIDERQKDIPLCVCVCFLITKRNARSWKTIKDRTRLDGDVDNDAQRNTRYLYKCWKKKENVLLFLWLRTRNATDAFLYSAKAPFVDAPQIHLTKTKLRHTASLEVHYIVIRTSTYNYILSQGFVMFSLFLCLSFLICFSCRFV